MREQSGPPVTLREWPFLTMVAVRVTPGSAACQRMALVLGAPLPTACGQTSSAGAHTALWLGPDEWIVVSQSDPCPLVSGLIEALADERGVVVDVSSNRTVLELHGPAARRVLEKGCPVDLHPRAFGAGRAVSTTLGPVPLVLWQTGASAYRLLPRTSFADYTARWLLDAMAEFTEDE
jgi:sarcosine oxidase subunit gamma